MIHKIAPITRNSSKTNTKKYPSRIYSRIVSGLNTKMEMCMRAKFKRVWKTDGGTTCISQDKNIQGALLTIRLMGTADIIFCRGQNMKETGVVAWSMVSEFLNSLIKMCTKAALVMMICMEKEYTDITMVTFSKASLRKGLGMELEYLREQMAGFRRDSGSTINSRCEFICSAIFIVDRLKYKFLNFLSMLSYAYKEVEYITFFKSLIIWRCFPWFL